MVPAYRRSLQEVNGARVIFLLDEFHDDNIATDEGVQVAKHLITHAAVGIIGVEGFEGGRAFDEQTRAYTRLFVPTSIDESRRIGDYPRFARALAEFDEIEVIGVDCRGLSNSIEIDIAEGLVHNGVRHPLHVARSQHFVETLLEAHMLKTEVNLLINCGARHNDDIAEALRNHTAPPRWREFTFIRFRPLSHSGGPP